MVDDAGFDLSFRSMLKDIFDAQTSEAGVVHMVAEGLTKVAALQLAMNGIVANMAESLLSINANLEKVLTNEGIIMSDTSALGTEIAALTVQVTNDTSVEASATTMIAGFSAQLAAAIAAAQAAGATPDQLASLTALGGDLDTGSAALAAAVAANTPAAPPAA